MEDKYTVRMSSLELSRVIAAGLVMRGEYPPWFKTHRLELELLEGPLGEGFEVVVTKKAKKE
jgi:hypothetical protein